jgi:hypothetical protein
MTSAEPVEPTNPSDDDIFEWPWPDSPGASHILARQRELEVVLQDRFPILLDTNFWVMAREAAFGEHDDPELISLLRALRMAVGSGISESCPSSLPQRMTDSGRTSPPDSCSA